jgi:23S rRNA (pseudouridine1915-N3)-methyltransferase
MLRFNLLWIGKTRDAWLRQGIDHYIKRIERYHQVNIIELKDKGRNNRLPADRLVRQEAEDIKKSIPKGNVHIIALDVNGKSLSSTGLAGMITSLEQNGIRDILWITGGAYGLDRSIVQMADTVLSLSRLTFTHDMTRLILSEQLYRACTIRNGEKYHH